jgi:hypothetical protein
LGAKVIEDGAVNKSNLPIRLLDQVVPWIDQAYTLHGFGERVIWEVTFGVLQPAPKQFAPILTLFSQIPGAQLQPHIDIAQIAALGVTEEACDQMVREAMGRMLHARTDALSQALAEGNGAPPGRTVRGGLILP